MSTLSSVAPQPAIPTMTPQVAQAYKDATDNLIYLKRDQFQVTYYVWLMLAALYILSTNVGSQHKVVLQAGVFLVGGISVLLVLNFHASMRQFRRRLQRIYEIYFTSSERDELVLEAAKPRWFITSMLVLACVVASGFTFSLVR